MKAAVPGVYSEAQAAEIAEREAADHLVVLKERKAWLDARIAAKRTVGWEVRWDERERDALAWAIAEIEAKR